ncbi:MAG: putative glycoside hydrolase [Treponema sp.]|jgi:hypothetical protein|nr:putative glycoside hydrolase [Treponema sp.]
MAFRNRMIKPAVFVLFIFGIVLFPLSLYSRGSSEKGKERTVEENPVERIQIPPPTHAPMIAGTDEGLFSIDSWGKIESLWSGGSVKKILSVESVAAAGNAAEDTWVILGSEGIFISTDLKIWESRNQGLPVKTIKIFQNGSKTFLPMVQEIKDVKMNPVNPDIMVCATKDQVYLSRNQGRSWTSLGAPLYRTNGIKAVASAYMPAENGGASVLTVFLSHSTYGLFYIQPERAGARWTEISNGLEALETSGNTDEIAAISVMLNPADADAAPEIYVSQTFRRRIYRLNWERKIFNLVWSDNSPFGTVDSLDGGRNAVRFLREGMAAEIDRVNAQVRERRDIMETIRSIPAQLQPNCIVIRDSERITLSELWLLNEPDPGNEAESASVMRNAGVVSGTQPAQMPYPVQAMNREGIYLPVNHAMDSSSLRPYLEIIRSRGLDMIVIDMKDDYGRLRFSPRNSAISGKGRVFRPLDLEAFLRDMRERGIYTVARVVVFKDPELAAKENGRYAVWDSRSGKPWMGYYDTRRRKSDISDADRNNRLLEFFPADNPEYEIVRSYYDERWVDPYSEEVWEYTAQIAEELHERGFDEIQFDYIRFPTDGVNLGDVRYRWQENGMDMESAILSFLRHIRSRVKAPISIDIYGANGWYRTGARTGQEVELLAPWVDVICPMYYPSHFEQDFLAQNPPELRPYRIYFQGTLRTARIGRGRVIVRPYVQAFYLNVSYDRQYYNADYVRRQVEGVRTAGNGGLIYWNNSGRYEDIPFPAQTRPGAAAEL